MLYTKVLLANHQLNWWFIIAFSAPKKTGSGSHRSRLLFIIVPVTPPARAE